MISFALCDFIMVFAIFDLAVFLFDVQAPMFKRKKVNSGVAVVDLVTDFFCVTQNL